MRDAKTFLLSLAIVAFGVALAFGGAVLNAYINRMVLRW